LRYAPLCPAHAARRITVQDRNMTELEFQSLANEGFNRIPLIAEALADLETPLSLYLKLAQPERNGANSFLLESVVGG
jgi:anthranilate synthase component 1